MSLSSFIAAITPSYSFQPSIVLGQAKYDDTVTDIAIGIPLSMLTRHGLIAGATGTGKTKSVQLLVEGCAQAGIPTVVMDMKGDISGLSVAGESNDKITARYTTLQKQFTPRGYDSEFMSLTGIPGYQRRTTIIELGPLILAQMLELNDTQTSVLSAIFFFCDKQGLALLDLKDLQAVIKYLSQDDINKKFESDYGLLSTSSLSVLLRKTIQLEQQGAEKIFGEPSLDIQDLMQHNQDGEGIITIMKVDDLQSKPNLFCAAVLGILSELYTTLPELGDVEQPKLVMIIDEAHLLFAQASDELLKQIETMIKLIRSKGIGIFFCTQLPDDIPAPILSQLGTKIQHALRAFTERDRKALKTAVENYPITEFYQTDQLITALGVGEILFTTLDPKGIPTPLVHVYNYTPRSRMGTLTESELQSLLTSSALMEKYNISMDRESASEILQKRASDTLVRPDRDTKPGGRTTSLEKFFGSRLVKKIGREIGNSAIRTALGYLGLKPRKNSSYL